MYTSLVVNEFWVTAVTKDHFEPGAYSNITEASLSSSYQGALYNYAQSINPILEGHNNRTQSYEDLTPSECTKFYNTDFLSTRRNLFLITNRNSNTTHNNTLLDTIYSSPDLAFPNRWMCAYGEVAMDQNAYNYMMPAWSCRPSKLTSDVASGHPWRITLARGEEVEISGCKSERTAEKCTVQFSLGIMIVVICCNLVKACCMVMAVVRSREPTLVTLGDAMDSFLTIPDPTTIGMCFADRRLIEREWRRGCTVGPRQWKQKRVQRWWTSAGKTRWISFNFFSSMAIVVATVLLRLGMKNDRVA